MLGLFTTPFTVLFKLNLLGDEFLVFARPVIYAFTSSAGKLYQSILGHVSILV